jgi:hypothetical protein
LKEKRKKKVNKCDDIFLKSKEWRCKISIEGVGR